MKAVQFSLSRYELLVFSASTFKIFYFFQIGKASQSQGNFGQHKPSFWIGNLRQNSNLMNGDTVHGCLRRWNSCTGVDSPSGGHLLHSAGEDRESFFLVSTEWWIG